jgi:ABC-type uncharacterized transport system substrate-binding protein
MFTNRDLNVRWLFLSICRHFREGEAMSIRRVLFAALSLVVTAIAAASMPGTVEAAAKKCLFISSYHKGYVHADQIEAGVRSTLKGHCELRQFDMDTKRRSSTEDKKNSALAAKAVIESWNPDIVITADDSAVKYLIEPFYKNKKLPFVFCGLNWTAAEYGLPYNNATGMIEVAPVGVMLDRAASIVPSFRRAFYLGADALSEKKNLKRFQVAAKKMGFQLDHALVGSTDEWIKTYARAQEYDVVIIGNRHGIKNWDHDLAVAGTMKATRRLSVTNHGWMMPYTILGMTKVSREQGEWAGKTAIRILGGQKIAKIPVVPNRQRDIWINSNILAASNVTLPQSVMRKGKKIAGLQAQ